MGSIAGEMSDHQSYENAVLRMSRLPLFATAMQVVTFAYSEVKGRYPLLNLVGGVAEGGVRTATNIAMTTATPILQSLEPQIDVANNLALVGLDRLERNFPVLNQSTTEVVGHLKDAFYLTLDDMQLMVAGGMDVALDQLERLVDSVRAAGKLLQDSQVGRAATIGLDDVVTRLEEAFAKYMPLPPALRGEWEMRVAELELEEESDEEPSLWTRVRSLLLTLSLQLYSRMAGLRDQLQDGGKVLDKVGLGFVLEILGDLLKNLQTFMVAVLYRAEGLRALALNQLRDQATLLADLGPVRQIKELPVQIQKILWDLQELSKLLVQLVINATPLYDMLQRSSTQEVDDFLTQDEFSASSRRGFANSLFLKAMDGRQSRRKIPHNPPTQPPNGRRRSSAKDAPLPLPLPTAAPAPARRRSSIVETLLALIVPLNQNQNAQELEDIPAETANVNSRRSSSLKDASIDPPYLETESPTISEGETSS